jgi:hypothetical protein
VACSIKTVRLRFVLIALSSGAPRNDTDGEEKENGIVTEFVKEADFGLIQPNDQQTCEGIEHKQHKARKQMHKKFADAYQGNKRCCSSGQMDAAQTKPDPR